MIAIALVAAMVTTVAWLRCRSTSARIVQSSAVQTEAAEVAPASRATVRVASFNAWLLPIGADDADQRREQMGPAIDALEPDVLCLQEVWTDGAVESLAVSLVHRLPEAVTSGGGLALLSRWPMRDAAFVEYPADTAPSFTEWLARKGFLSAVIETPAGPLRLVNSHLAFDRSADREDHRQQMAVLLGALSDWTDIPTVLCADLNFRSNVDGRPTEAFLRFLEAGFEDAASVDADGLPAERQGTRVGWPRRGRRAGWDPDYVMFRAGDTGTLSVVSFRQALHTAETALSDHNLQLADFVLAP